MVRTNGFERKTNKEIINQYNQIVSFLVFTLQTCIDTYVYVWNIHTIIICLFHVFLKKSRLTNSHYYESGMGHIERSVF